ncbi:FAD/NAD(P)-binding oxidoreductase [Agrobacterium tumefaciens]|uniref:FAD/NAD(P)-dependent oxidoreductase n=1 Tax=Agrobacterium tumefaciens TaxID=358 RepID=UPI00080FE754|nr:FAD/NAD(P)-binding oxidoreductase [Agrobacterium tumefaciens]
MTMESREKVVIVGAGPAGMRAAATLVSAGIRPVIIDEGLKSGGQIYRRPPDCFRRPPKKLYGSEVHKAVALHSMFDELVASGQMDYHPQCSVLAVSQKVLHVLTPAGRREFSYDRLILAIGAMDRLAPIPGWQLPGVFGLGAAQIALKAQGVALGREIVLAGSGPLLTLVATQLLAAGANIRAVLDTSSLRTQFSGLFEMLARPRLVLRGLFYRATLGRLYHAGVRLENIVGGEDGPTGIHWKDINGDAQYTACDMVALGWHLRSETQLAGLAGCNFDYDHDWAQWLPRADQMGRAGNGLYLAGDGLKILGADGAEIAGRLAAAGCLTDMGLDAPDTASDLRLMTRYVRFARGIARAFPWPREMVQALPDHTIVCRCEGVTAGSLRASVSYGGSEANRAKSLSRVGMGRCQGRYCQIAGAELIAGQAGIAACDVGRLREQGPVRPLPIGTWAQDI